MTSYQKLVIIRTLAKAAPEIYTNQRSSKAEQLEMSVEELDHQVAEERTKQAASRADGTLVNTSEINDLKWFWPNRFPRGKLVILDGDPGLSKSMFSLRVAISGMFDKPFIDGTRPQVTGGVVLLSAEDDLRDTINPRLRAAGAPVGEIPMVFVPATKRDGTQFSLSDQNDRHDLEEMVKKVNAVLMIIDPLNAYLGEKVDSNNDKEIRRVLGPLSEMANRTGCVILSLRHCNKSGGGKAIYRGLGSIGYTAAARAQFFMAEHPEEPGTFVFACAKFNLGPKPDSLKYKLDFVDVPGISSPVPFVASAETCALTANDLAASVQSTGDKLSDAMEFLEAVLEYGRVTAKEVEQKAFKQKISTRTLRRARIELKIEPYQEGGKWWWQLPGAPKKIPF